MNQEEVWSLCKLTLSLNLILAAAVYATHGAPPQPIQSEIRMREPANSPIVLEEGVEASKEKSTSTQIVDLKCVNVSKKTIRLNTEDSQVRVVGENCDKKMKLEMYRVENSSNGFEASLFPRKNNRFSTDYVTLDQGTNALKVLAIVDGVRTVISELLIQRSYEK